MPECVDNTCTLYWIRLKDEHVDIFTQGYVGVTTKSLSKRMNQHRYTANKGNNANIISKAIRKYGDSLTIEPILIGSLDYCLDMERKLRPVAGIGYNSAEGGRLVGKVGTKFGEEYSEKLSNAIKKAYKDDPTYVERVNSVKRGRKLSESHRLKVKEAMNSITYLPWENSNARKDIWLLAAEVYEFLKENPKVTRRVLANRFKFEQKSTLDTLREKLNSGWNPIMDEKWLEFKAENTK